VVLAGCISVRQTGLPWPPNAAGSVFRTGLHIWSACADKSLAVFQCQPETGLQSCLAVGRFWEAPMSWSSAATYKHRMLLPLWRSSQKECRARESVLRPRCPFDEAHSRTNRRAFQTVAYECVQDDVGALPVKLGNSDVLSRSGLKHLVLE